MTCGLFRKCYVTCIYVNKFALRARLLEYSRMLLVLYATCTLNDISKIMVLKGMCSLVSLKIMFIP